MKNIDKLKILIVGLTAVLALTNFNKNSSDKRLVSNYEFSFKI